MQMECHLQTLLQMPLALLKIQCLIKKLFAIAFIKMSLNLYNSSVKFFRIFCYDFSIENLIQKVTVLHEKTENEMKKMFTLMKEKQNKDKLFKFVIKLIVFLFRFIILLFTKQNHLSGICVVDTRFFSPSIKVIKHDSIFFCLQDIQQIL